MKNLKVFCLALILLLTTTRCQESETEDAFGGEDTDECEDYQNLGLWTFNGDSLNLLSLSTNVYIEGPYALVEHTLVYDNSFTDDRNYIFYFNKPTAAIVNNISATWNNREVDAWLIAKDEAEEIYDDFSAEEQSVDIDLRDVPAFVVGRVPAGRAITITYETIQPLTLVANKYWGFSMYASLSPKDVFRTREWNSTPDYEETILQGGEINDWNVSVNISSRRGMDRTISPNYVFEPRNQEIGNRTYTWWEGTINTNRDFIIFFTSERVHTPTYVLTRHPTYAQDYIFGYALVVEGDGRTVDDVSREIQDANSIVEVDANVNETAILRDIRTSCWCINSAGEIIFRAESDDDSWRRGQAYEKYFYLRNLQNPQGCRLNFTYVNTYTRATHTRSFTFRGFELARTTDEWHKIAYEDRIEDLREENEDDDDNEGDNEDGDNTDALIDELALRYQLKNEDNVWVTVDNNNNRTFLDDSVKYHFAPEVEEEAEAGQNEEGNAEDGEVIEVIEVEDDTEDLGGDAGEGQGDDVEDGQGDDGAQDDNFEEAAPEEEDTGTVVVITPVNNDGQASNDENQGENNEENEEDQGGYY